MFNESNIICFLTLAETLSFKKTACIMSVSQQAVSQIISRMESKLGVKLFTRNRRHVEITPAGQEFYDFFFRYKQEYDELCESVRSQFEKLQGSITAGYQNWIDYGVEPQYAFEEIRTIAPDFQVNVTRRSPGALISGLLNHELDMVVMYDQFAPKLGDLKTVPLMSMETEVIAASDHPLAVEGATYMDFCHEPVIFDLFENETEAMAKRRVKAALDPMGFAPKDFIVTHDLEACFTLVEKKEGIALSSSISRMVRSYNINNYPTGRYGNLICAWQWSGASRLLDEYARCLQKAYRKTGRGNFHSEGGE